MRQQSSNLNPDLPDSKTQISKCYTDLHSYCYSFIQSGFYLLVTSEQRKPIVYLENLGAGAENETLPWCSGSRRRAVI